MAFIFNNISMFGDFCKEKATPCLTRNSHLRTKNIQQ